MAATTDGSTPEPGPDASIDEIQADIAKTREELGETVSALAEKADVKAQVQAKVADTKQIAAERAHVVQETVRRNPGLDAGVLLGLAAVIGVILWVRRRRNR